MQMDNVACPLKLLQADNLSQADWVKLAVLSKCSGRAMYTALQKHWKEGSENVPGGAHYLNWDKL